MGQALAHEPEPSVMLARHVLPYLLLVLGTSAHAAPLKADDPASVWPGASSSERAAWAGNASGSCGSLRCNATAIRTCLDDALRPPVPKVPTNLGEATATCVKLLKSRG